MEQRQQHSSRTDKVLRKYYKELHQAHLLVASFLEKNGFRPGQLNSKRGWFTKTYPLHLAVKQGDAYITAKLLMFGADPSLKDCWGWKAYEYAVRAQKWEILNAFDQHFKHCHPWNKLQCCPPPCGFEEFFANLEQDWRGMT
eukprot:Skav233062  [mRNA]  locus=scaffold1001:107840:108467:- [translate_table: standard]